MWSELAAALASDDRKTDLDANISRYRTDLDLVASHGNFPWIPIWDDHEVADNTYRDGSSELNNTEASFIKDGGVSVDQRKMNAVRAYFEWMPIRQVEMGDDVSLTVASAAWIGHADPECLAPHLALLLHWQPAGFDHA